MGYSASDFMGEHTSFWCDHDGCTFDPIGNSIRGKTTPTGAIDWLHARGWEIVGSSLYCAVHVRAGVAHFAEVYRRGHLAGAESEGRKLIEGEVMRTGTVSEETKAKVRDLLQRAENRAMREIREEEAVRLGRHTRRAAKAAAATVASTVLDELKR